MIWSTMDDPLSKPDSAEPQTESLHKRTHVRLRQMLEKSWRWVLGIGLYFTLKQNMPLFADALSADPNKSPSASLVVLFTLAVTVIGVAMIVLIETFIRHAERVRHLIEGHSDDQVLHEEEALRRRVACGAFPCLSCQHADPLRGNLFVLKLADALESVLRLNVSFVVGKAWLAFAFAVSESASIP